MFNLSTIIQQPLDLITPQKIPLSIRDKLLNVVPKILKPSLSIVPFKVQQKVLLSALDSVFSEAVADGDFKFLENKWLKITITDLGLIWWLSFTDNKLVMEKKGDDFKEDVSFSGTGDDLMLIAGRQQDPDTLFFQRRLKIEGDTELGLEVKNLIDAIDTEQLPSSVHKVVQYSAVFIQSTHDKTQH